MPRNRADTLIAWLLVSIQAALIAAVVLLPRDPTWAWGSWADLAGWALVAAGVGLGLWGARHLGRGLTPLPLPNGEVDLVTRGPYRHIRHPIYSAVVLATAGIALRSRSMLVITVAALLAAFLAGKARWEEAHLRQTFDGYAAYAERTAGFVPLRLPNRGRRPGYRGPSAG